VEHTNEAMQVGIADEHKVRGLYRTHVWMEEGEEYDFDSALLESQKYPFMAASLDGYCPELKRIVEIKNHLKPDSPDFAEAKAGRVPKKYHAQLTHQYVVADQECTIDYVAFNGLEMAVVRFTPTQDQIDAVINAAQKFWGYVQAKERPPQDFMSPLFSRFEIATSDEALKEAEENARLRDLLAESDARLLGLVTASSARIGPVKISSRAGKRFVQRA
jgi:predicted phage-related endonuclease